MLASARVERLVFELLLLRASFSGISPFGIWLMIWLNKKCTNRREKMSKDDHWAAKVQIQLTIRRRLDRSHTKSNSLFSVGGSLRDAH